MSLRVLPPDEAKRNARARLADWKRERQRKLYGDVQRAPIVQAEDSLPKVAPSLSEVIEQAMMVLDPALEQTERRLLKRPVDILYHFNRWMEEGLDEEEFRQAAVKAYRDVYMKIDGYLKRKGHKVDTVELMKKAIERRAQGFRQRSHEVLLCEMHRFNEVYTALFDQEVK